MSRVDVVNQIGDALTQIDTLLCKPDFSPSSPKWQQLFALRKHLDDQQRELVQEAFDEDSQPFRDLADKLGVATAALRIIADDISKLGAILETVASIASLVDKVLNLAL